MTLQDQFEEDFASIWQVRFLSYAERLALLKQMRTIYSYSDAHGEVAQAWEGYRLAYRRFNNDK